jgi:hypothetical protein
MPLLYMYVWQLDRQKKSLKHYCTIHYQKLTGHSLEFKQIVSGVISAENFMPLGLKCGQFKALLDEIWLLSDTDDL